MKKLPDRKRSYPDSYGLGTGEAASGRLDFQHALLKQDSENHLIEAGLKEGMTVLELGCGNGNMTLWIAAKVGEKGHVIALDRDLQQIEIARARAASLGLKNIEFTCGDIENLNFSPCSIDFVYSRFFLMHLPSPLSVVKKAFSFLKQEGVFAAQEPINSSLFLYPKNAPFIEDLKQHFLNMSKIYGVDYDLGQSLYTLFYQAQYHPIHLYFSQRGMPLSHMKDLTLQFLHETTAALKRRGLSVANLLETIKAIQKYPEQAGFYFVAPQQAHVIAYKTTT